MSTVDGDGAVSMSFRLPTYWCAANFAFLMAEDMRDAVAALPWVTRVTVTLGEHMYSETINRGHGGETLLPDGFRVPKPTTISPRCAAPSWSRPFSVGRSCWAIICSRPVMRPKAWRSLTIAELRVCTEYAPKVRLLVQRYLDRARSVVGVADEGSPAFVDEHGEPVPPQAFRAHLRALRRVAVNVEFNGALCRGLLAARFNEQRVR